MILGSNTGSTIATSSNNIIIADGAGNERIRVDSTGNVGIGTTTPGYALEVSPPSSMGNTVHIQYTTDGSDYYESLYSNLNVSATSDYGQSQTAGKFAIFNNSTGNQLAEFTAATEAEAFVSGSGTKLATHGVHSMAGADADSQDLASFYGGVKVTGNTTTNAYGSYFEISKILTGNITNAYGVYTGTIQGTNKWSFYAADATAPSYFAGNVGIGTNSPEASSILDISSTSKGVVLPRMTKAQRDAIASPVAGMAVYQTDNTPGLRVYNGTNWMRFTETVD